MGADPDPEAILDEQRRAHELRFVVDLACAMLRQGRMRRKEAEELVAATRRRVLALFPGKEDVFELVLAPRFSRLLEEFAVRPARVLPFQARRRHEE
jgi:hypothetical protein